MCPITTLLLLLQLLLLLLLYDEYLLLLLHLPKSKMTALQSNKLRYAS